MEKDQRKDLDDGVSIQTAIEAFFKNQKFRERLRIIKNIGGKYGEKAVIILVINQELERLKENNSDLWENLLQLINHFGYVHSIEGEGGYLMISHP